MAVFEGIPGHAESPLNARFDAFFEELYDLFARADVWRLYPDVIEVLQAVRARGVTVGMVSNWDSRLLSICQALELESYFDFILASAVVGSAKPEAKIFEKALELANCRPDEAIHIGDSLENDWQGARAVGLEAIIINRDERIFEDVVAVSSLQAILPLLEA